MAKSSLLYLLTALAIFSNAFQVTAGRAVAAPVAGPASGCKRSDLVVRQSATGRVVEGKPEYAVEVSNRCRCALSRVLLRCYGLSSVEAVDPRAIRPVDDERCVLGGGRPIARGAAVRFTYAWMTPQDFPLLSSQTHC